MQSHLSPATKEITQTDSVRFSRKWTAPIAKLYYLAWWNDRPAGMQMKVIRIWVIDYLDAAEGT